MTTWMDIISLLLNLVLGGGLLVTLLTLRAARQKANIEVDQAKVDVEGTMLDNDEKASRVLIDYVVDPLKREISGLRRDVRRLQQAIDKIPECPHADSCPVKTEMKNDKEIIDEGGGLRGDTPERI